LNQNLLAKCSAAGGESRLSRGAAKKHVFSSSITLSTTVELHCEQTKKKDDNNTWQRGDVTESIAKHIIHGFRDTKI
jgi:hypothetical protein